jgi:quercetin dioxygenase-like cupin family protein
MTEAATTTPGAPRRKARRIEIFCAEGEKLGPRVVPVEGLDEMAAFVKVAGNGTIMKEAGELAGTKVRCLFRQSEDNGFSLIYVWFKSGYVLPRHSHNTDCLYYVIAGELKMGAKVLRKGDGMFIPANAGYTYEAGPDGVEVLEFRSASLIHINLKGNDESHLNRIAKAYRENTQSWAEETVPPSERAAVATAK